MLLTVHIAIDTLYSFAIFFCIFQIKHTFTISKEIIGIMKLLVSDGMKTEKKEQNHNFLNSASVNKFYCLKMAMTDTRVCFTVIGADFVW